MLKSVPLHLAVRYGMRVLSGALILMLFNGCANHHDNIQPKPSINPAATVLPDQPIKQADQAVIKVALKNVTLWDLTLNDADNRIIIKPGSTIQAKIHYAYHCSDCLKSLNNQIIIGLARRSAQACIYDGGPDGEGVAVFTLKAPAKPGKYEIRFRGLQSVNCDAALKAGWTSDTSPPKSTTIGTIIASKKANPSSA